MIKLLQHIMPYLGSENLEVRSKNKFSTITPEETRLRLEAKKHRKKRNKLAKRARKLNKL